MNIFLLAIEFFSCVLLILAVLLHTAKGEGLGSIGGTARLFGAPKGLESGLDKFTVVVATTFLASATLLYLFS